MTLEPRALAQASTVPSQYQGPHLGSFKWWHRISPQLPVQASLRLRQDLSTQLVHLGLALCCDLQASAVPLADQCVPCSQPLNSPAEASAIAHCACQGPLALQGMKGSYSVKLPFKNENKMKILSEKQKLKVLVTDCD